MENPLTSSIPEPAAPVAPTQRIQAIDVCRGFALLGILTVNMQFFGEPFGSWMMFGREGEPAIDQWAHKFVSVFAEGKFYPLFSMLFGMGLALQFMRGRREGAQFTRRYLRRIGFLFFLGLAHALLLWYGDILFIYSFCATALLLCIRFKARTLLTIALAIVCISAPLTGGFSALNAFKPPVEAAAESPADESAPEPAKTEPAPARTPLQELFAGFEEFGSASSPDQAWWLESETRAYRDGPWLQAFGFRAISWASILVFGLFGFAWHALAMFFLGAALLKMGLFEERRRAWAVRFVLLGFGVGLPIVVGGLLARDHLPPIAGLFLWGFTGQIGGPLMSLGYIGAIIVIVRNARGLVAAAAGLVANAGRMALTNYLMQTIVSTAIFYHWGLAMFGQTGDAQRLGLAALIWTCQLGLSTVWLRMFRFGPMEWLWRSVTYLKVQPMRRAVGVRSA